MKFINIPTVCPVCGGQTKISCKNNSEILVCDNENCPGKLINKLVHFVSKKGLDIKGLSKATLEKLIDWNWINTFSDIFNLSSHRNEWITKQGFGEKSVDNILESIEKSKTVSLDAFISSIGIPLIGNSVSKTLLEYIDSYEDFRNKVDNKWNFSLINGFAENKTNALLNFDYSDADAVSVYLNIFKPEVISSDNNLKDIKIVITGSLKEFKNRNELKEEIERRGGKVISSISNNTNYLINNDINSISSKNIAAKKLNIPIISEKEFKEKFLT